MQHRSRCARLLPLLSLVACVHTNATTRAPRARSSNAAAPTPAPVPHDLAPVITPRDIVSASEPEILKDSDLDTIVDIEDECPNVRETFNGFEDVDGCPDEIPVMIGCTTTLRGIWFQDGGATIPASERMSLDRAVRALEQYPEIRVEVRGHADSSRSAARALEISRKRAEAVKVYLVAKGVAPDRIETRAAGADEPVASNDTREGRRRNRRVEFRILAE